MRLIKNFLNSCLRLFGHVKVFFISYRLTLGVHTLFNNYKLRTAFDLFRYRLKHLYCKIIRFKIVFRIIRFDKIEYSYLTIDLGEIRSSNKTRECANKNLLNDDTKRWDKTYNWNALYKDIRRYGLLTPLEIRICNSFDPEINKYCRYCIVDGNHRVTILKELYPPTHKVKVKISNEIFNSNETNIDITSIDKEAERLRIKKEILKIKAEKNVLNK